jgi:hypothetical protein
VSDAELAARIYRIYDGSDGDATRALYAELEALGPAGIVALNLVRAQKSSSRAKVYRGGGYRGMAYDRKEWAMANICSTLGAHGAALGIAWGWGEDEKQGFHKHVLYVDLPTGQASFHCAARGDGPRYNGAWDGIPNASAQRILSWIIRLLSAAPGGGSPAPTGETASLRLA